MPTIDELMKKNTNLAPLPETTGVRISPLEPDRIDLNLYNEAKSQGVDMTNITSNLGLQEGLANSQSSAEKWLNDLGRLGTGAASATVGGFAMIPAFFDAASSMELSAMYENGAVKWAEGLDEWGQEKFKNYYTQRQEEAYKEASIFEKMTYGEKFWGNSVLANAGFMIGAAVDEAIFSALTAVTGGGAAPLQVAETGWLAARLARRLAEAGTEVMGSGTNLIKNVYRGFTAEGEIAKQAMMSGLKNSRQLLTSAGYESSVEALQFQKEAYNQVLDKKVNELGISKEELENNPLYEQTLGELKSGVNSVANGLWLMNLATVGSSNAIGATALFQLEKPILNMLEGVNPLRAFMSAGVEDLAKTAGKEIGKDGVQFAAKNLSMAQKAFNIVKSPLSEGAEEFSQGLYQDVGKRYLEDKYNPNAIDMIIGGIPLMADEIGKRLGDSSHSGWEEFASGFMSSLLGLPNVGRFVGKKENGNYGLKNDKEQPAWVGGIFQGIAENRQIQNERNKNAALNNFLSDKNLAEMLDGKLSTDNITTASVKAFPMIMAAQKRLADGIKSGDKFEQNQAKHDLLAYAAIARDKIGQVENFKKDVLAQYDQHTAILQKGVTAESTQEEIQSVANLESIYQGNTTQEKIAEVNRKKKNTEIKLKDIEAGISRAKAFNLSPDLQDRMAVALSNGNNRVSEANSLLKALQASLKLPNIQVSNLSSNELYELLDKHKVATSKHKKISDSLQKDKAEFDSLPDEIVAFEGEFPRANEKKKAVKERVDNWTKELDAETARLEKELNKKVSEVDFTVESPLTQYREAIDKLQGDEKVQAESLFNDVQRAINQHKESVKEYNLIMNNPVKAQKQEDEAKEKIQRQIEGKPEVSQIPVVENPPVEATKSEIEELEIKEVSGSLNYMLSKINENSTDEDFEITEAIIQRVMELKSILSKLESKRKQLETNLEYYTSLEKSGVDSREKIISLRDKTLERISFIDTLIDKINTILKGMAKMLKEYTDKALSLYKQIEKLKNDIGLTFQGDESSLIKYISNASDVFSIPESEHENFYTQVKSAFSKLTALFQQAEQDSTDIFNLRQQEIYEKELLSEERDILANKVDLLNNLLEKSDLIIVEEYVTEEDIILEEERNQKAEQEKIRLAKEKQDKEEKEKHEIEMANLKLEKEKLQAEEKEFQEMLKKEHEKESLKRQKEQEEIARKKAEQDLKDKEEQEENNKITQKKLQENSDLLFDVVNKGKKVDIELIESINPNDYKGRTINGVSGDVYIQALKSQALAKLSNQRNSPYYSVQSITTIDRADNDNLRLNNINNSNKTQYELDLDTPVNEDEFEIVTAPFNTGKNTKKVDKNGDPVVGKNPRLENIPNQKGTTIAVVRKGTNKIIGFINDRIFQYKDKNGKMIPFLKPNTRELNPEFNVAWIGMEGKQAEIQDQLNLLSTLTSGSLVKTTEGKLRFPKENATTNLTNVEELFSNPEVSSVSVFQRIYQDGNVLYQEWKYNRERKIWEAGNISDQDRLDANTLAITYKDGHVSNISVNVSKENELKWFKSALNNLANKGTTSTSKVGGSVFFTINSDEISQTVVIEENKDGTRVAIKVLKGAKGEKETQVFEWTNIQEYLDLIKTFQSMKLEESLEAFKQFFNEKLKIASDKGNLQNVYKLYTISFNDESFDKEIAAGKYIIPKMEGKLSVVSVEKADIAVNEGVISKDNSFEETIENTPLAPKMPINKGALETGQYVKYNDEVYIITKQNSNGTWQIYNPNLEGVNAKKSVSKDKLELVNGKAKIVTYRDADYIVTSKNTIISLTSNKKVFEDEKNGNRLAILDLAKQETSENPSIEDVSFEEKTLEEVAFEEKSYTQQEIKDYVKANKENKTEEVRFELEKMKNWAEKNDGKLFTALSNLLNTFPKTQLSNKKSEITHQKAVEIFKEYFPNSALSLEDVSAVLGKLSFLSNSVVYGVYNGLVRLRQGGTLKDTPFFEGFRLVFNALISDKEKSQILEEAKMKYFLGLSKDKKETVLKEFQKTYSPKLNGEYVWQGKELENYYLETMLAREFANKATSNKPKSFIQKLFDKIRSWLGIAKIDNLFNKILDKEFKDFPYNPNENKQTVKTMLDVYSSESETGKDLMTSENAYRIANRIFSKMARDKMSFETALAVTRKYYDDLAEIPGILNETKTSLEILSSSINEIDEFDERNEIGLQNIEKLRKEVEDRKAILSFDPDAVSEEDNENKDIAIRDGENFSQSLRELGGEMSASKKFKEYLSTIMYVDDEFDLFGTAFSEEFKNMSDKEQKKFYIPVDFISVYNTMLKLTAGKPKSEILGLNGTGLLNLMKDTDKQLLAVVNQMNVDIANPQEFDTTLDMILSNLEKQKVQGKIILQDNETGKFDMVDENAQGIENSQINKWTSEYEMRHVGKVEATKELKAILDHPKSADEVYKALNKYGFKVSRLYCQWCYGLKTGKYENDIILKIATEYGLTTNNSILDKTNIEYIFDKIINRENENAKLIAKGLPGVETIFPNGDIYFGEKKNEGSRNKLKAVAFGNSIFDSSVKNLSYKNSENKTVYEIIARMQVGDFVNIINKIIKANKQGELTYDAIRKKILDLKNDNEEIEKLLKTEVGGKYPYLSFINSIYNLVQEGKDMENGEDMALKDVQDILIDLGKFIFHNNLENFVEKDDKGNYKQMEIGFLGGYRETSGKIIEDTYIEDEKSKSKAGTTFSSANEQEKTLALLGVWMKGWYNPIVAAGKSMQFIFKGNKVKRITPQKIEDTKNILMNWFDQEIHRIDRGVKGQVSKDIDKYEQKSQKFFENKAFVDSLANTDLKEIYSAFIEVDSKDANLVAAKLQEKKDFIEKYKTDKQFRDNIKEALFDFHNNLSLNFANKTIGTIGINLPQVLIDKKEKLVENDLNEGTENHRLMVNVLQEFYFDDLINSTAFYNTFIGDKAMSLKGYIDVNKRAGKHIAGGVSSETANRNIRAVGMKSIKQMLGVDEDFQIDKDWYSERGNYPLKNKDKFEPTDTTDAESYQTVRVNIDFYLKSNAKYTKEVHDIYEMIDYGIEPSFDWWEKLDKNNAALQKRKMVYADFLQYIKTSVNTLTWQECSVWNNETQTMLKGKTQEEQLAIIKDLTNGDVSKVANFRIALPSRQKMFDLLSFMQKEKIDYVYHDSASKSLQRRIRAKDFDKLEAKNAHYLNPTYWKEQVATDGVKMEVVDSTQKIQLIFSEQNGEIKVDIGQNTFDLEKVSDTYKQYLANRISMMYEKVLAELQNEDGAINIDELKAGFVKALEKSGSTQQTIKFFKESNINLPHIVEKAESMFMSRVSKVLSHKKPGSALALASPKLYPIMRATTKIELSNGRTISENEVISTETYKKFSSEFTEGKNFAISRLRHGVKEGKHYYAEIILPANHPALAYMKDGFIPAEFAEMVGIRIPTQDKHSMLSMKVVDVIPAYKGSTVIVPLESILLSGEDFDIDKKYIYWYAGYQTVNGWKKYGDYKTEKELLFELGKIAMSEFEDLSEQSKEIKIENKELRKYLNSIYDNLKSLFTTKEELKKTKGYSEFIENINISKSLSEEISSTKEELLFYKNALKLMPKGSSLEGDVSYYQNKLNTLIDNAKALDEEIKEFSNSNNLTEISSEIKRLLSEKDLTNAKLESNQSAMETIYQEIAFRDIDKYEKMLKRMEENKAGKLEKTQTNKYEIDNDLLDLEKVMVHNNGNNDIAYTPSSMDIVNQAVQSHILLVDKERLRCAEFYGMELAAFDTLPSSEKVEKIQKFVKEKGYINVYGNHSPLDKLTAYYNNDVGSKNIEVWALSNVVMQTLIKESKYIKVENGAYMLHGIRINDIISSFLSSATDNDKEQHAAILQLDQEKCGIMFDLMWRQGLHPTVALGIIYIGEGGTNLDIETLLALNPNLSETDARFLNDLMQGSEQAMEKQKYLLKSSTNAAKYTMALTTLMSLNKGFKSTIADNQTIVEAIKTLKKGVVDKETGLTLPKPYDGWNIVQSDIHLKEEVDKFEKVYDELTPKVFLIRNEKLRNALEKMTASLKGMNYPTNRTKVYRDLISYVIVNIIKNNDSLVQNYAKIGGEEIFTTGLISKVKTILTPKVDNSLMKGLTAIKKVMKQGEFTGKTIDSVVMNTWLKAVRFVDEKMQNDYERFNRRPHALEEIKIAMEQSNTQGINIFTKSNDELGRALTNPNWGYKKDGKNYYDVETEYKANTSKIKRPDLSMSEALKYDMNLMYQLQVKKFQQNPELIDMINKRGGLQFILNSEHTVGVKNSRWEGKGSGSNFIKVLAKSYEKVAKDLNKFVEGKKSKSLDEILSNIDTNHLMGTLARLMYIQSVVKEGLQFKSGSVNSLISTPLFAQTNGLIDRLMNEKNFEEITGKSADRLMIDFIRNFVADESNKSFLPSLYKQEYFMEANEQGDTLGNARQALKNAGFNFDEKKKVIPAFGINYGKVRLVLSENSIKAMLNDEEFTPIYESIVTKGGKDVVGYRNDEIKSGEKIGNGMYYTGKKEAELEADLIKQSLDKIKNQTLAEKIYVNLPKKTESGNVLIKSVYQQKGIEYAKSIGGIFSLRIDNNNTNFGNPFSSVQSEIDKGLIPTNSTKESVEKYIDWVLNSEDKRAIWIKEQLNSGVLKGKAIVYYKELNQPSHANALDYLINNWESLKNQSVEANKMVVPKSMSEITNHSGGAAKYDTYWDNIGKEFGMKNTTHYTVAFYDKLSEVEKAKYDNLYQQAVNWLGRSIIDKNGYAGKLVRRDMIQAEKAGGIFAISEIVAPNVKGRKGHVNKTNHPIVEGGTGYAVASGILQNKPVYVFNQDSNYGYGIGWYQWKNNDFVKVEIPILTKNFAGIGSSTNETEIGKQAIRDIYEKTQNSLRPKDEEKVSNITFNDEQKSAINQAIEFIKSGNPKEWFVIEGKAGVGKTTIAEQIVRNFPNKNTSVAALSHKAKSVIRDKFRESGIKANFYSLAGLLGQKLNMETGEFERDEFSMTTPPIEMSDLILIDEASMINEQALELIMQTKPTNAKVIFLGDIGQLPPIRTEKNEYYKNKKALLGKKSPVFEGTNKAKLLTRIRQGEESPILPYADFYWENSQVSNPVDYPATNKKDVVSSKGTLQFVDKFADIKDEVVNEFRQSVGTNNPNHIKVVTYRNATRESINEYVHNSLFGNQNEFNKGELIIFNDSYDSIENSTESQISDITEVKTDENGLKYVDLTIIYESKIKLIPVVLKESKEDYKKLISAKFASAKAKTGLDRKLAMKEAWAFKGKYANLDYGYAITSHKSQGSTYDIVVVDEKDIMSVSPISAKEKSESIYTALTRARNKVISISEKSKSPTEIANEIKANQKSVAQAFENENFDEIESIPTLLENEISKSELDSLGLNIDEWNNLDKETQDKMRDCNL